MSWSTAANGSSRSSTSTPDHQQAGERHALLHAAGQVPRVGVLEPVQADQVEQLVRLPFGALVELPAELRREQRVLERGTPRQQRRPLEHHSDVLPRLRHLAAVHRDAAVAQRDEAGDRAGAASTCRSRSGRRCETNSPGVASKLTLSTASTPPSNCLTASVTAIVPRASAACCCSARTVLLAGVPAPVPAIVCAAIVCDPIARLSESSRLTRVKARFRPRRPAPSSRGRPGAARGGSRAAARRRPEGARA